MTEVISFHDLSIQKEEGMKSTTEKEVFQEIREAQGAMYKVIQHAQTAINDAYVALSLLEDGNIDEAIERIQRCEDCYWEIRRENWNCWSVILSYLKRLTEE